VEGLQRHAICNVTYYKVRAGDTLPPPSPLPSSLKLELALEGSRGSLLPAPAHTYTEEGSFPLSWENGLPKGSIRF